MSSGLSELTAALAPAYGIERELGRGGMAVVYLARDLKHNRPVAVKVLNREIAAAVGTQRFVNEIEVASGLNHPHILPLLDSGTARLPGGVELPFYVMPYVQGESLRDRLRREKQLPVPEALRLAGEVADALEYAHGHGVMHRDIKPENVLLSDGHAVVADFGVARALGGAGGERLTTIGVAIGTPQYMSPEQAAGESDLDARTDVYALGCVLYEMLVGEPPFTGPTAQLVLARKLAGEITSVREARPAVPAGIDRALARALAVVRADRFATAAGFREALAGAAAPVPPRMRRGRRPWLAAVALVGVVAAAALAVWRSRGPPDVDPDLIAVAPFDVLGVKPELALWREGLVDVLSRNLDGAGPLRSVSPSAVIRAWTGRADRTAALRFAARSGAGLVVFGQLLESGEDSVRLAAQLIEAAGRTIIGEYEFRGPTSRIDALADTLTVALFEELGRTRKIGALRLRAGSTAPLPALRAFLQGEQFFRRASWDSALASYERAIAVDSTFTVALYRAGLVLSWLRLHADSLARDYRYRAARLNRGLAPRDSLLIHADSLSSALYDLPPLSWGLRTRLIDGLRAATRRYPDDAEMWNALGEEGFHHGMDGGMPQEEVLAALERVIALDSSFVPAYIHAIALAYQTRDRAHALRLARAFLDRAPGSIQAEGIRIALRLTQPGASRDAEIRRELGRVPPQALFEGWAATLWSADSGEAAVALARELVRRGQVSAPLLADEGFRRGLLVSALLLRGHVREVADSLIDIEPAALPLLARVGAVPPESADVRFRAWLSSADARAVHGLEWWADRRDTAAIAAFARLCGPPAPAGAPCFGDFGEHAAAAYYALAHGDSATALERFLAVPDTLCLCNLHRLTAVRLLHQFDRNAAAAERLRSPVGGLLLSEGVDRILWEIERARSAERMGDTSLALARWERIAALWRFADPQLADIVRVVDDARRRLRR